MSEFLIIFSKSKDIRDYQHLVSPGADPGVSRPNSHMLKITKPNFHLSADISARHYGLIHVEENDNGEDASAIVTFGWCYRLGSGKYSLEKSDLTRWLTSHRNNGIPEADFLSGIYCIISYDHVTESVWICADLWAQHSFYYGADEDMVVIGSKAAQVADILRRPFDGVSYIALLRGTAFPPGRSLFANVWQATCGRAINLDLKAGEARITQIQSLYRPIERMSFREAVDRFIDVTTRVIPSAASQPDTIVDMSGGNDTRITAAALGYLDDGKIRKSVTFRVSQAEDHPDSIIAHEVAHAMDWRLIRCDLDLPINYTHENLNQAAIASDGKLLLPRILNRQVRESLYWEDATGVLASQGGELFRDYFWRHELHNIGRTNKVNFTAFLKHRLYASNLVEIERISHQQLDIDTHNECLIEPYIDVDNILPDVLNVYKLNRFHLFKVMPNSWSWNISNIRLMIYPFYSHEISDVSMSIPWIHRIGRRLITTAIKRMAPKLAEIPTDNGAPMEPFSFKNLGIYVKWLGADIYSGYYRHFSRNKFAAFHSLGYEVEPLELDIVQAGKSARQIYDNCKLIDTVIKQNGKRLDRSSYNEFEALLLVELLIQKYSQLDSTLSFSSEGANIRSESVFL